MKEQERAANFPDLQLPLPAPRSTLQLCPAITIEVIPHKNPWNAEVNVARCHFCPERMECKLPKALREHNQ